MMNIVLYKKKKRIPVNQKKMRLLNSIKKLNGDLLIFLENLIKYKKELKI